MSAERDRMTRAYTEAVNKLTGGAQEGPGRAAVDPFGIPLGQDIDGTAEVMVCMTCAEPLNNFTGPGDEVFWVHQRSWLTYDHEPEPTLVPRAQVTAYLCDFCGISMEPIWAFQGSRIKIVTQDRVDDNGSVWRACKSCSPFIFEDDLEGMLAYCERVNPAFRFGSDDRPEVRQVIRAEALKMWKLFLPSVTGVTYIGPVDPPAKLNPRLLPKLQLGLLKFWRHPALLTLLNNRTDDSSVHIPGLHVTGTEEQILYSFQNGEQITADVWNRHTTHLCSGIEGSELFWVAANFTQLSIQAAHDFEKIKLTREKLPAKFGFIVYAEPIGELARGNGHNSGVRAVTWTLIPNGVWFNFYVQGEDGDPEARVEEMRREVGWLVSTNAGMAVPFDEEVEAEHVHVLVRAVISTWGLMGQPGVASVEPGPVDKGDARAYKRQYRRNPPDVNIVDLRKRPRRAEKPSSTGRRLEYRVIRKSHWKEQAYGPGWALRRDIYISQYLAGPEDAPFKPPTPTVKVLK